MPLHEAILSLDIVGAIVWIGLGAGVQQPGLRLMVAVPFKVASREPDAVTVLHLRPPL